MKSNCSVVRNLSPNWPLALVTFVQNAPGKNAGKRITHGLKTLIVTSALLPGDRLPSALKLSEILGVHPKTVYRAFGNLAAVGLVRTVSTTGTFVARRGSANLRDLGLAQRIDDALSRAAIEAKVCGVSLDQLRTTLDRCWREMP